MDTKDIVAFAHQVGFDDLRPYQAELLRRIEISGKRFGKTQIINGLREEFYRRNPGKTLFNLSAIRRTGRIELRKIRKKILALRKGPNRSQWQRMKNGTWN